MCVVCERRPWGGCQTPLCVVLQMHFGEYHPSWPPAVSVAACCSVLHCVAVCCRWRDFLSPLMIASCISFPWHGAVGGSVLQCVAVYCSTLHTASFDHLPFVIASCVIFLWYSVVCCGVLQRVAVFALFMMVSCHVNCLCYAAVFCSVLQCVAVCCRRRVLISRLIISLKVIFFWYGVVCCSMLQYIAACCICPSHNIFLWHGVVYCSELQYIAACRSVRQCVATLALFIMSPAVSVAFALA